MISSVVNNTRPYFDGNGTEPSYDMLLCHLRYPPNGCVLPVVQVVSLGVG